MTDRRDEVDAMMGRVGAADEIREALQRTNDRLADLVAA